MQIKRGRYIIDKSLISNICYNYAVWEPTQRTETGGFTHSTTTTIDGVWYGRLGTRELPPEIDALKPGSEERILAVREWHEQQYEEAYKLITEAFPEAAEGVKNMGSIDLYPRRKTVREIVINAVKQYRKEGNRGIDWVFFNLAPEERDAFDAHLVRLNHPLAHQPGTQEYRFRAFVREVAYYLV